MTSQLKQQARQTLKGKYWILIGLLIVMTIISSLPTLIDPETYKPISDTNEVVTGTELALTFLSLFLHLLILPITIGWAWIVLSAVRGEKPAISKLFEPFRKGYVKNLVAAFLVGLFTFLWSLLLLIPGIIKWFSYSLTYYILRDQPELSGLEAITESRRMMDGYKMEAFKLVLSFIGWFFVGLLTLGLGFLFIYPYFSATYAAFYESVRERNQGETYSPGMTDGTEQGF